MAETTQTQHPHGTIPAREAPAREALKEQVGTVGEDVRELGRRTKEAAREELEHVRRRGHDAVESARGRYEDAESSLVQCVRDRPLRSLAYAAGIGLVLGILVRR